MPTRLQQKQAAYKEQTRTAQRARAAFVAEIRKQRDDEGRTLEDIGDELGLTRARVHQLLGGGEWSAK